MIDSILARQVTLKTGLKFFNLIFSLLKITKMKKKIFLGVTVCLFIVATMISTKTSQATVNPNCPNGCLANGNGCYCNGWYECLLEAGNN